MDENPRPKIRFSLGSAKPNERQKIAAARLLSERERKLATEQAELQAVIAETEADHSTEASIPAPSWDQIKRNFQAPPTGPRGFDSRGRRQRKAEDDFDGLFADAPPSISERKRERQEAQLRSEIDYDELAIAGTKRDRLGRPIAHDLGLSGDTDRATGRAKNAFDVYGDEEEVNDMNPDDLDKHSPRQTVVCRNLPPHFTENDIRNLLPATLTIDNIKILPADTMFESNRGAQQAIVWFGRQEKTRDIESGIRPLKKKYLGWGFELDVYSSVSSNVLKERHIDSLRDTLMPELREEIKSFGAKKISEPKALNKVAPTGIPADEKSTHGRLRRSHGRRSNFVNFTHQLRQKLSL